MGVVGIDTRNSIYMPKYHIRMAFYHIVKGKTPRYSMNVFGDQLVQAMEDKNTRVSTLLVAKLSNVNYQTIQRHTALHSAIFYNDLTVAKLLLAKGANMMLMPRNRTYDNKHECALLMALKMGEQRAEMQSLLIGDMRAQMTHDHYAETCSRKDLDKIECVSHYAMLYSTPVVFSDTIEHNLDANTRNVDNMTPYMHTIREVANFERDVEVCRIKMGHVITLVDQYPEMLWTRYHRVDVKVGRPYVSEKKTSTGLGMVIFECITERCNRLSVDIAQYEAEIQYDTIPETTCILQKRIEKNAAVVQFFKAEFIPNIFLRMMQPVFVALSMATHVRLGGNNGCGIGVLHNDTINLIFLLLLHDLDTADLEQMLC